MPRIFPIFRKPINYPITITMKKLSLTGIIVMLCCVAFAQSNITLGPYLQKVTQSGIIVKWWTDDTTTTATVKYGTEPNNLNMTATDATLSSRHTVKLSGLTAYKRYYYAIYDGSTLLEGGDAQHTFRTFPEESNNVPFRTWAIGDFGKGNDKQRMVREAYTVYDTVGTDLWIWLGDNVYDDGTEAEYVSKVFTGGNGYQDVMKYLPFQPCPGNHDYNSISPVTSPTPPLTHTGPYYNFVEVYDSAQAGGVPTNHELFYSFDYSNTHFISLNSELGSVLNTNNDWTGVRLQGGFTSSPLTDWLHADLAANDKEWTVVYFHQPPYTDGSHESGAWYEVYMKAMRENITPILEQYGVDLVVCGHTHVYERSYLVKGAYGDAEDIVPANILQNQTGNDAIGEAYYKDTTGPNANQGTVYVNNGNSGSSESNGAFNHPYMYSEYGCDTCCGSFVFDIDGGKLTGRHIDMHGVVRDEFTMYKGAKPTSVKDVAENETVGNFKVQPNPFQNAATVKFDLKKDSDINIRLTDLAGTTTNVFSGKLSSGSHTYQIDATQLKLATGFYVLSIHTGTDKAVKTIIKMDE
jgi:hypothetical protein